MAIYMIFTNDNHVLMILETSESFTYREARKMTKNVSGIKLIGPLTEAQERQLDAVQDSGELPTYTDGKITGESRAEWEKSTDPDNRQSFLVGRMKGMICF